MTGRSSRVAAAIIEGPVAPQPKATTTPNTPASTWITVSCAQTSAPTALDQHGDREHPDQRHEADGGGEAQDAGEEGNGRRPIVAIVVAQC